MKFMSSSLSKVGGRRNNQDFCGFLQNKEKFIWVVADGMGGHYGGEFASSIATESLLQQFHTLKEVTKENTIALLQYANDQVRLAQKEIPQCDNMQTTMALTLTNGQSTILSNIGDSRAYYFSEGKLMNQTKDHSIPQLLVYQGEIHQQEIRNHEDRNKVLRSIGKEDSIKPDFLIIDHPLKQGDAFLLCTDGFWEAVLEQEMEVDLIKSKTTDDWLKRMELRLLGRISDHHDNYTALAAFYL